MPGLAGQPQHIRGQEQGNGPGLQLVRSMEQLAAREREPATDLLNWQGLAIWDEFECRAQIRLRRGCKAAEPALESDSGFAFSRNGRILTTGKQTTPA
jgi:hypothetical protein